MRSLATLIFVCPCTRQELEYTVEVDARALVKRWSKNLKCRCPYCKSVHSFAFRTGYVDGIISHVGQAQGDPSPSLSVR
jgi:hypothetical protein